MLLDFMTYNATDFTSSSRGAQQLRCSLPLDKLAHLLHLLAPPCQSSMKRFDLRPVQHPWLYPCDPRDSRVLVHRAADEFESG